MSDRGSIAPSNGASERVPRLIVRGLYKTFPRGVGRATVFRVLRGLVAREPKQEDRLIALEDVTFQVDDGEIIGIVGPNGAGKTTLLKLLAGLYRPTSGEIVRHGRPTLLSGLGVGMVSDLSVRENVYLYGAICRLDHARVDEIFDEILEWAELTDFSVTRYVESELMLLDEAEGAGDQRFVGKVTDYFERRPRRGSAVLISSHSLDFIERFCTRAIWLRYGEQVAFGATDEVVGRYREWAT
jgi:ABC-type polysaccharide/polyol phosphate transport system ATPase subunit